MGEHQRRPIRALARLKQDPTAAQVADTLGGRMHARWDAGAPGTAHGQLGYYPTKPGRPLKTLIANIRAALQHVKNTAEQFKSIDPWAVFLRYVSNKIAHVFAPFTPPDSLPDTG